MPKVIPKEQLDALVAAAGGSEHGLSVEAFAQCFPDLPRRSLQRRLARLVGQDRLIATGKGPARRYRSSVSAHAAPNADQAHQAPGMGRPSLEDYVPTSHQGNQLRELVRQPLSQRTPVGYRKPFLDGYKPNTTFYLPQTTRDRLQDLGRSRSTPNPAGTYARQILNRLLVDLSWSSSRLEGNTYSRLDTQNLIEFGRFADGKDRLEAQMILNHKAAIEMLVDQAEEIGFNRYTLQNLHALLADNLLPDPDAGGRLRTIDVGIGSSVYHPVAIPQVISECFDNILAKATAIEDAFEQAFFVMVQLPYLQPFEDVNKRVSRLAANIPLIKRNLAPLSFVDVPETSYIDGTLAVYELNRIELLRDVFVWAYERSCQRYTLVKQALPEPDPLRLRYRDALIQVVGDMVRNRSAMTSETIRQLAGPTVAADDSSAFVAMVFNEVSHLHEGNIARYKLRPSEFRRWRDGKLS